MEKIKYYDEEKGMELEYSKEDFVKRYSWDLPYDFVKQQADSDEEIRMPLYHQLLKRSKAPMYSEMLKESPYYKDLYQDILNGDNETDKIDLAIYFDNDLIESIFGGVNNLVQRVINTPFEEETFFNSAMKLVDISQFDLDDETVETIKEGISTLVDKDYEEMDKIGASIGLPGINPETSAQAKEENKQALINKVNANRKAKC